MSKKLHTWKITFMTDYPYSDYILVDAYTEEEAWDQFEERQGYERDEYCSIEQIS